MSHRGTWRHGEHRRRFFDTRIGALVLGIAFGAVAMAALWTYVEARG